MRRGRRPEAPGSPLLLATTASLATTALAASPAPISSLAPVALAAASLHAAECTVHP